MSDQQALLDLLGRRPSTIELDRAALEIARLECPDVDVTGCIAELDRHAWAVAERAGDLSDGARFVEAANSYLFGDLGFRGNEDDYYDPANSCLNRVLETKRGIPIYAFGDLHRNRAASGETGVRRRSPVSFSGALRRHRFHGDHRPVPRRSDSG
jgi:hypothetical protein